MSDQLLAGMWQPKMGSSRGLGYPTRSPYLRDFDPNRPLSIIGCGKSTPRRFALLERIKRG